jgi:hypothetical protein
MSEPTCVNLSELYGDRFRIFWDEAYDPDYKHVPKDLRDPWYMELRGGERGPGRNSGPGFSIYPYGHNTLALEIDYHNPTAAKIAKIPGVRIHQDGDQEKTLLFDVSLFEQIAPLLKLRKKRLVSEAERARLAHVGAATRLTARRL